jgi:predicted metal-binding membrane protein
MNNASVASAPKLARRDRIAIVTGLLGVSAVAWIYLVAMALQMDDMQAGGHAMQGMGAMGAMGGVSAGPLTAGAIAETVATIRPWGGADFALMFVMWAVMMVGMMVPTAAPATLIYAAVARKAERQGTPVAPTAFFVLGYVGMWTLFSLAATVLQWALDQAALLSPMLVTTSPALGGGILVAAGLYQLTPFKDACLAHCRSPAHFIAQNWSPGVGGAFRLGLRNGAYCLGCCWILMGLLFFGGVMSLAWIAGITFFVLAEKVLPHGRGGGRIAGVALVVAGASVILLA